MSTSVEGTRDVAGPYAISIAETFDAHAAAVAFSYEPVIPATIMGGIPASLIEQQRTDNDKAAPTRSANSKPPRSARGFRSSRAS